VSDGVSITLLELDIPFALDILVNHGVLSRPKRLKEQERNRELGARNRLYPLQCSHRKFTCRSLSSASTVAGNEKPHPLEIPDRAVDWF
jgi:hypothetical protein